MPKIASANGFIGGRGLGGGNVTSFTGQQRIGGTWRRLQRALNKSHGSRKERATLLALTGAAAGAASKAYSNSRIKANEGVATSQVGRNDLGGRRSIETVAYQTGNTVAGDLTSFDTIIAARSRPASYPADRSGFVPGRINRLA